MQEYRYSGPVMEFGRCIADYWKGKTVAPSEAKARSNLAFQFKRENEKPVNSKIELPGKLVRVA